MKPLGFFLLLTGWAIDLAALAIMGGGNAMASFVVCGVAVEILGLGLVIRSHLTRGRDGA